MNKNMVSRPRIGAFSDTQAGAGIRLRIQIDQERPHLCRRKRSTEIDGCRCLTDATLLIGYSYDFSHDRLRIVPRGTIKSQAWDRGLCPAVRSTWNKLPISRGQEWSN